MPIKFEKGVPIPEDGRGKRRSPAWQIQPGDSIVLPSTSRPSWGIILRKRGLHYVSRDVGEGNIRLWCLEKKS
jgi:hypothetical protein